MRPISTSKPADSSPISEHDLRRLTVDHVDDDLWLRCGEALAGRPEIVMSMPDLAARLGVPAWPRRRSEPLAEYLHRRHSDILLLRGVGSSRRLLVSWCVARLIDRSVGLPGEHVSVNPAQAALANHIDQQFALLETNEQAQVFAMRVGGLCRALIELATVSPPLASARDLDLLSRRLGEARTSEVTLSALAGATDVGRERVRQILEAHGDTLTALRPGWAAGSARALDAAIRAGASDHVVDRLARVAVLLGNAARTIGSTQPQPARRPAQPSLRARPRRISQARIAAASLQ